MTQYGDLLISAPMLSGLSYPSFKLPESTPLKPYRVNDSGGLQDQPALEPMNVNPSMLEPDGGYLIAVCNVSTATRHTVQGVSVRFDDIAAYTGQLNQWNLCDGPYYTQSGNVSGGCGGGMSMDENMHATFPADAAQGATVQAIQTSTGSGQPNGPSFGPLPVTLAPGQGFVLDVGLTAPSAPGTYSFSFAIRVDGTALPFQLATPHVLLAPAAHKWSGQACLSSDMKSQIPSSPAAAYICPES